MKIWHYLLVSSAVAIAAASSAQAQTNISADTQPGFDTSTTVTTAGNTTVISGGEAAGGNLFHSFSDFDLASGDIASWVRGSADAASILNIVNRVRSGAPSEINGTIRVADMPNASFFFINPAGVIFGDGASVDVPGSAYFSTAHQLEFGGGERFSTVTPDGSTFSSAPPAAFGFLGGQSRIDQAGALVTEGTATASVSLVSSDVRITGAILGDGTHFDFAAIGGGQEMVALTDIGLPTGDGQVFVSSGALVVADSINAAGSLVVVEGGRLVGNGTGALALRGDEVVVIAGGELTTESRLGSAGDIIIEGGFVDLSFDSTLQTFAGFDPNAHGGDIRILAEFLSLDGTRILTETASDADGGSVFIDAFSVGFFGGEIRTFGFGNGATGSVNINAFDYFMPGGRIDTRTFSDGLGGDVRINANVFHLAGGLITTTALGSTASGTLSINSDTAIFSDRGILQTQAAGSGGASSGALIVNTHDALFFGGEVASAGFNGAGVGPVEFTATGLLQMTGGFNQIASASLGGGDAGDVTVHAGEALLEGEALIESFTDGTDARSGNIVFAVDGGLSMSGGASVNSVARGAGEAGSVNVSASALSLRDDARIQSVNEGSGNAGVVALSLSGDLSLEGGAFIESIVGGTGDAGAIFIDAANVSLAGGTFIRSIDFGPSGTAASVTLDLAGDLLLSGGAVIESASTDNGDAGDVFVSAENTTIAGNSVVRSIVFGEVGNAGSVGFDLTGDFLLTGGSVIESSTLSEGDTGGISIAAANAAVRDNALIQSAVFGNGNGGAVRFDVENQMLADSFSTIIAFTQGDGDGGDVIIRAGDLLAQNTFITADVLGDGIGGRLDIEVVGTIRLSGDTFLATISEFGQAGDVRIIAGDTLFLDDVNSSISASASVFGSGGSVFVQAPNIMIGTNPDSVAPGGRISSVAQGASGAAGDIVVVTDNLVMNGGSISASALFQSRSNAGSVTVIAGTAHLMNLAEIGASTFGDGDAGQVRITADELIVENSFISSITDFGPGNAGSVEIDAGLLRIIDGEIRSATRAFGNAGTVDITADRLEMSGGLITSLTLGDGDAGDVTVRAGVIDITGGFISSTSSRSFPNANGDFLEATGDAGSVEIFADSLSFSGRSGIATATVGVGEAGNVLVRVTDELNMSGNTFIAASTAGSGNAGVLDVEAGSITLSDSAAITSGTGGAGSAGDITIATDSLSLFGDARISSRTAEGSTGSAGRVNVEVAGDLSLADAATIAATTESVGDAGLVRVTANRLTMTGGSIDSSTSAEGDAGDVLVVADSAQLSGDARINSSALRNSTGNAGNVRVDVAGVLGITDAAAITAATLSSGDAGLVTINAGSLMMTGGAVASSSDGEGDAGDVEINANSVRLRGNARVNSAALADSTGAAGQVTINSGGLVEVSEGARISASTRGPGDAGQVLIDTDTLIMDGGEITSFTSGSGDAGLVLIRANNASLTNGATINSLTEEGSTGDAGGVGVSVTGTLTITNDDGDYEPGLGETSEISATTFGSGDAGVVFVTAGDIVLRGGDITSATHGPGLAGDVTVEAQNLSVLFDSSIDSQAELGSSGGAGDVTVTVTDTLRIEPEGNISASSEGTGDAGTVEVRAGLLDMAGGAINSFTAGSGDAGLVGVFVDELVMAGGRIDSASDSDAPNAGRAGSVFIAAGNASLSGAAEIDSTGVSGDAGDVTVAVSGRLDMADSATISAATQGSGNAGSVEVSADLLSMTGGEINSITTGSGDAGSVSVLARELQMSGGRITSASEDPDPVTSATASAAPFQLATAPAGDAGDVLLRANNAFLADGASIDSTSQSSNAGTVTVEISDLLSLGNDAQISTAALGGGDAGDIDISAATLLLDNFSSISSTAAGTFSAGTIQINSSLIRIDNGSSVSTNSDNGPAGDIGLFLPSDGFLGLSGRDPGVITTSSGANTGGRITISDPFLILSEGGSILALGEQGGANVQISSDFFIRSSDTVNLISVDGSLLIESNVGEQITGTEVPTVDFLDASGILSGVCAAVRRSGEVSQFSTRITGPYGLPPAPDESAPAPSSPEEGETDPIARSDVPTMAVCL
ncbi:filamentous hemagglutinin N-terminal domain-containing protein [uncultured Erythrobacter sp.]|uniref:two-partner secretion domain-containing protein n=1 Tax=uncultured Erythrobacter sp. TaxID=263913 RepID=UPI0026199FEC|nr:filamentous hemagglutinin N-terminal domain-containing protein [uncultured Erythrobacter sp.]